MKTYRFLDCDELTDGFQTCSEFYVRIEEAQAELAAKDAEIAKLRKDAAILSKWKFFVNESDGRIWLSLQCKEGSAVLSAALLNDNGQTIAAQIVRKFGKDLEGQAK